MSDTSRLPIDIVVGVDEASVGVAFSKIKSKWDSFEGQSKLKVGGADSYKELNAAFDKYQRDVKAGLSSLSSYEKSVQAEAIQINKQFDAQRNALRKQQEAFDILSYEKRTKAYTDSQVEAIQINKQFDAQRSALRKQQELLDIQSYEKRTKAYADSQAEALKLNKQFDAQRKAASVETTFKTAGIRSPQDVANELAALRETKKVWEAMGPATEGYNGALAQIASRTNILTEGNARARGSFHKMTAALASLTFEITGAIYGLATIATVTAGGAIFGIKFLKDIEDAKMGISGTVLSMNLLAKESMTTGQAMEISNRVIGTLEQDSLKYNVSLADTAKLFQAIVGPGTAARMTMEEIGKTAVIGAVAVKSMGLNSMQVIQEVKDLVQGGIQSASSTLATALGLRDSDIKRAKESTQGLFAFLEERMAGFAMMSMERNNTLSGSMDMLWMKVQRLFADPAVFSALVDGIKQISDSIGTIEKDENGNFAGLRLNEDLVKSVKLYSEAITQTIKVTATAIEYAIKLGSVIGQLILPIGAVYAAMKLWPILIQSTFAMFIADVVALTSALGGSVAAMYAVETVMLRLKTIAMSIGVGGLIGAFIVGVTMIDWKGIFDQIFVSFADRIAGAKNQIRSLSTLALQEERKTLIQDIADVSVKKDASGRFTGESKGVFEMSNADIIERDSKRARLAAVEQRLGEKIESDKRQADLDRAQEIRVSTIQQGFKAEQSLAEAYIKNDPSAKRAQAIKKADEELGAALSGLGERLQQKEPISLEEYKKRELEIVTHYNHAIEQANKSQEKQVKAPKDTSAKDDYAKQSAEINDALNAGTTTFEQAYEKRKVILEGYISKKINVHNFEKELSKATLEFYKVEASQIDESVAEGVRSYSEGYDAKVALIESFKNKSISAATAEIETNNLRIKLAKDSTAAMKDIDAATAKYADTMSAGERVIADFNNATKDKVDIMEKEMAVLKALPNPTQEQKDKLEALTKSTDAYNKANVMVTETISPLAQALSNLAKITRETDAAIDKIDLEASLKGGGPLAMLEAQNLKLVELQNQYVRADEELKKFVQTQIDAGNTLADYDAETLERYTQLTNGVDKHRKAAKDLENQLDKTFGKGAKQAFEEYQIVAKDTASQANNLFSNMFKNIEDAFTNFIMTGKMDFKAFVNSMIADLARMAAKQIVLSFLGIGSAVMSGAAGAVGTGVAGNVASSAGSSMLGGLGSSFATSSMMQGAIAGGGFFGEMAGGVAGAMQGGIASGFNAGMSMIGLEGGFASGLGLMLPGIGLAIGGIALLTSFLQDKGGPKIEGNAFGTMDDNGYFTSQTTGTNPAPYGDGDWGRPGADAGKVEAILAPVGESIAQYINGLGGSASGIGFAMGFNTDPEGEAPDNVMGTVRDAAGNDVYRHVFDTERGKGVEALQEEIPKMMLAAAQAVDISPITNALLDGITNIEEMSVERANDLLSKTSLIAEMSMDDFTQLFGETTFDPAQFDEFGRAGELTIDTFSRLAGVFGATNAVATMLGKDAASAFGAVGLASTDMRQKLIDGAGGMDKLTEQAGFFYQSFYSESERASKAVEAANNQVIASFAEMGIAVPESEAAFRSLVEGLDLSTESGQEMYQKLMDIAPAFDAVAEATKAATNSIASSLDKLRGNNAASTALATINRNNAMATLAANSDIETIDQLLTISAEDLAAYEKLNPAIYQLIAAALGAEATLQGLGDSATTAAAAATAYSNSISMGEIISNSQAIVDGIMSTISGTVGTGFSATATTQITAMQDLITRTQEELAATPTTGDYTGNREQLRSIIHDANQQINILTSDLARYTELEAQYAGHGEALLELEKWYNSQLGVYQQYGISSTSLVEEFERRKLEILASGGADTVNGVTDVVDALKNSFSQLDSLIKLSDSIEDSINSVLAAQGDYQSGLVTVNRRLEEAREKLNNAVGIDEQTKAAGELKSAIMARYQAEANEIARIQSLISQLGQLSDRIRGSIESIKSSMLGYSGVNYATEQVSKGYAGLEDATTTEEQIIAADKLKEAIMGRYSAEMSDLQKRKDAENEAGRAAVDATNKLNAAFRALGDYAKELLTGAESALTSPAKLAETQRQYDSLLTLARGGDVEAAGKIQGLASNLLGQSRDASGTALDYARSFSKVQGAMSELGTMAGTDREYAENTAKWEAETLGIQNRTIDELTLLGDLTETWITELEDTLPDLEALQQSTLEELERLNQLTVEWQEAINDSIIEQAIQFMQLNLTASQIAVELSGLDSRIAAIINATQKAILVEPDYTFTTMQLDSNIPGFASGGDHDGGWRVVGESGPELEYTQPSNIYSSSKSSDMFTSLATELSELRSELAASRQETLAANRAIAKNSMETAKMLQKWDGDGQPEVRVV